MKLYLDDDSVASALVAMLRKGGHDVIIPSDIGRVGAADSVHFAEAIRRRHVVLSHNAGDFTDLHNLIATANGRHVGILIVRKDNDRRDMTPRAIVAAIERLIATELPIENNVHILNHYR